MDVMLLYKPNSGILLSQCVSACLRKIGIGHIYTILVFFACCFCDDLVKFGNSSDNENTRDGMMAVNGVEQSEKFDLTVKGLKIKSSACDNILNVCTNTAHSHEISRISNIVLMTYTKNLLRILNESTKKITKIGHKDTYKINGWLKITKTELFDVSTLRDSRIIREIESSKEQLRDKFFYSLYIFLKDNKFKMSVNNSDVISIKGTTAGYEKLRKKCCDFISRRITAAARSCQSAVNTRGKCVYTDVHANSKQIIPGDCSEKDKENASFNICTSNFISNMCAKEGFELSNQVIINDVEIYELDENLHASTVAEEITELRSDETDPNVMLQMADGISPIASDDDHPGNTQNNSGFLSEDSSNINNVDYCTSKNIKIDKKENHNFPLESINYVILMPPPRYFVLPVNAKLVNKALSGIVYPVLLCFQSSGDVYVYYPDFYLSYLTND